MNTNKFNNRQPFSLVNSVEYANEGIVSIRVIDKSAGSVTLFAFDEAQKLSEHTAPFDALVQVLEGEAQISIEGEPNLLTAGDSILMPGGIPHAVLAKKQFKMLLTMIKA